jgi:anti-sigma factor RsiW
MRCEELAEVVAASVDGDDSDDWRVRRHLSTCLRCQAELARYRKLVRALRGLRSEVFDPGPGLVADVLASLEEAGERHLLRSLLSGHKVAYVGGLAVATAGAAGALVIATRSRGRRVPLAG